MTEIVIFRNNIVQNQVDQLRAFWELRKHHISLLHISTRALQFFEIYILRIFIVIYSKKIENSRTKASKRKYKPSRKPIRMNNPGFHLTGQKIKKIKEKWGKIKNINLHKLGMTVQWISFDNKEGNASCAACFIWFKQEYNYYFSDNWCHF